MTRWDYGVLLLQYSTYQIYSATLIRDHTDLVVLIIVLLNVGFKKVSFRLRCPLQLLTRNFSSPNSSPQVAIKFLRPYFIFTFCGKCICI